MTASDALIIGAGIVGAACARALALRGLTVTVVEAGVVGGGATAAGMGHLVVLDDSPAEFALTRDSQLLWQELAPDLPPDVEATTCGTLWVAANDGELAAARAKEAFYRAHGVPAEVIDAPTLRRLEPALREDLLGALLVPEDGVIYPPNAASWLIGRSPLIHVDSGRAVRQLDGESVTFDDGTRRAAGVVVLATGARAPELVPGLPIRRKKGHLVITDRHPSFVRHQLVELGYLQSAHGGATESVAFNVQPRATGQVLIGSSRQFDVADPRVEPHMVQRMLARALEFLPTLARLAAIRTWTGFRAATPDGLPLIGAHPTIPGLWLATGHEGLGITTSLSTGDLLAAQITGASPRIDPLPYRPDRFATLAGARHE